MFGVKIVAVIGLLAFAQAQTDLNVTTTSAPALKVAPSPVIQTPSPAGQPGGGDGYGGGGNSCKNCPCYPATTTKTKVITEICYVTVTAPCTAK